MKLIAFILLAPALAVIFSCSQKQASAAGNEKQLNEVIVTPADANPDPKEDKDLSKYSQATFAAGCFWAESYIFESLNGVIRVLPGYAGGTKQHPTYEQVASGKTGHAESVNVYYDPAKIDYATLLKVFFISQDPTQVNGQGPDEGTEYRSIVFYRNTKEKQMAEAYINNLIHSGHYGKPIATQVVAYSTFWPAESYHYDYFDQHPNESYVQQEIVTRIKPFQKTCTNLIRPDKNMLNK